MYSLICQNHSSNQPEPSLYCVWGVGQTVCMFVPVCTVQLCCRFYMRPPFKVSFSDTQSELDHDWDQERREAAKGRYGWKWGSICGTFSFPQKCEKKQRLHSRPSRSIVSESAAMYSGWCGTEKKDRKVLQNLCGSNREICDGSSAQQSCVFGQRAAERSSVLLRKLCRLTQHCHLLLTAASDM